jgi:excisionase family DNA binding protein
MKQLPSAQRESGRELAVTPTPAHGLPHLLPAPDAARVIGVSERTLFTLTKSGQIPAVRIGRAVRYDPTDIQRFIERAKSQVSK